MAQVSRAAHASSVATKLADNASGDISAQDLREVVTDLEDSCVWFDELANQTDESIQDIVGAMLSGNTETRIVVTYQDADGTIDFVVDNDLSNYDNSSSAFLTAITGESIGDLSDVTLTSVAQGDVLYRNASGWVNLGPGTSGQFLQTQGAGANPQWATPAGSGDVSKVGTPVNNQIGVWTGDGTLEGDANFTWSGSVFEFTGGMLLNERGNHAATPSAGKAELWVKNDATQKLQFTDDAGTDKEVAFVTGGSDLSAYTGVLGLNSGAAVDVNTKALLEARLSDVSDLAEADGDVYTGTHDFGGADDLEIPNSATPTVDTDGQIAIDTTVTDFSHGIFKYYSGEEMAVVAMPIAELTSPTDGYVVAYNATNDEFELVANSGGGGLNDVVDDTTPQLGGDLDVNGNDIVSVSNGDINITPNGTGRVVISSPQSAHRVYEDTTAGASAHTLVLADQDSFIEMNNASAQTVTIPANATTAFPVGSTITIVMMGAGTTTILAASGVTLQGNGGSASAGSTTILTQYGMATLYKRATNTWVVSGDIAAVS